jgi:tellurite resistance protein TehA-like permease
MSSMTSMTSIREAVARLHPAYFAMVMATGIVAVASDLRGLRSVALGLCWLNVGLYVILWALTIARAVFFRRELVADLGDHNRCVGFFTTVAATCVLGNQFVVIVREPRVAVALWYFGTVLWAVATYTIFTVLTVKQEKPPLSEGINGGWLVAVVAAQSVSALGGLVAGEFAAARPVVLFFTLVMWLGGGMLYIWIIVLIFYRYSFFSFEPGQLAPPYWINMGAVAISTLAGAVLIDNARDAPLLMELLPFLKGLTLLFWSTATWWIPLLVLLGVWRHVIRRFPLRYEVIYWSMVFPLGMYTAATHRMSQVLEVPFLMTFPQYFLYAALAAWTVTFGSLLWVLVRGSARPPQATPLSSAPTT